MLNILFGRGDVVKIKIQQNLKYNLNAAIMIIHATHSYVM